MTLDPRVLEISSFLSRAIWSIFFKCSMFPRSSPSHWSTFRRLFFLRNALFFPLQVCAKILVGQNFFLSRVIVVRCTDTVSYSVWVECIIIILPGLSSKPQHVDILVTVISLRLGARHSYLQQNIVLYQWIYDVLLELSRVSPARYIMLDYYSIPRILSYALDLNTRFQ